MAAETPRYLVRYRTRNGTAIMPARLTNVVAAMTQTSAGRPRRPRYGFRRETTNPSGLRCWRRGSGGADNIGPIDVSEHDNNRVRAILGARCRVGQVR